MLKNAKLRPSVVEDVKRTKRTKKRVEEKPALIVTKINGQYRIEMQAMPDNPKDSNQYTPLVYKIESANNDAKIRKKLRLQNRLVKAAIKNVWSDPYHPENCEKVCLPAYREAIGLSLDEEEAVWNEVEESDDSCTCEDEETISSCSSSEVNWEIHFTPPIQSYKATEKMELIDGA